LQHIQAQSTEKMEQLTSSMGELGIMAQKEATAMRIITVVTVIFLPATFVSVSNPSSSSAS
jgi:Mg2+ and Co2+ transporter CorA